VLGRLGLQVCLVDRHAEYPPEFRVEKIAGDQVELLQALELIDCIAAVSCPFDQVWNIHRGRLLDRTNSRHYGVLYHDIVRAVRAELPASVPFFVERVTDISNGPLTQRVTLSNQSTIDARLIVIATGMSEALRKKLGTTRRVLFERHSISFGFDIAPQGGSSFSFPALTYYGERAADGIDYLSLFPTGSSMRANLFTFRDHRDPWIRELRQAPKETLLATLPGLVPWLSDFTVPGQVQNWMMDLYTVDNARRDGVVLIGDAFQTSCPAAGTGVSRLLRDVERLRHYVPQWLASPAMPAAKIAQFYDDPLKQASDRRATNLAYYRRSLTTDTGLRWRAHRQQVYVRRRIGGWLQGLAGPALMRSRIVRA